MPFIFGSRSGRENRTSLAYAPVGYRGEEKPMSLLKTHYLVAE